MTTLADSTLDLFPHSLVSHGNYEFSLVRNESGNQLVILSASSLPEFDGEQSELGGLVLTLCRQTARNAAALRTHMPWLEPKPLGLVTSAGMGDRMGLATAGHVRATRAVGGRLAPIFIQQSIREMNRTGRTPQQVLDDATWGIFAEGWQAPHGADADHLKSFDDIDICLASGYTFYTIDPGSHVDNRAETASLGQLRELSIALPVDMQVNESGLIGKHFNLEGLEISFDEMTLLKAAVKYGRAIDFVAGMYRHLEKAAGRRPFELEVSVDETEQPTSHAEHVYIACELKRLGVHWVSLAPRYVGRFEKGVDYIGSLPAFETDFSGHAAIARHFGPYKLSLHSGSDKFSIYPIAARLSQGLVHLKTAGTSYLEALHTIASTEPGFLGEIYQFARECYETDRASYHVSAELARASLPEAVTDWNVLLEQFDAREILHVTFGSVLTEKTADGKWLFRDRLVKFLQTHQEAYASNLERNFIRHLTPFMQG